ncbi:hypothetical protein SAMN05216404_11081 [Nitrosospira multiformis]|uniref:Uncharacterized protein n=1 Tax=Nitrosospira multiformis TaxID=1231 RepID=A0A1H8LF03_9PROT|nr:DUF6519 domain-containing protein [Nitrosospira multiformis]SEO03653.1 hypothetical protein SAMN05216404_11081 [Nitrosospira multiformis]
MASDISRTDDSERQHYKGVVMQQGRVVLDRDFNALQQIAGQRTDADALDFVGPCGTPDNGFAIEALIPSSPPLRVPPPPLNALMARNRDFLISPGTMYVGGQRAVFSSADYRLKTSYSYFDQPDWIEPDEPNTDATLEFVYLHLLEQEVSAIEDTDLKDVALGGPDTTQRVRLIKRVKRLKVDSSDCTAAFAQAQAWWRNNNLTFDPKTMRLLPQVSLQISFSTQASQPDPCEPVTQGGYLQPENQLIRVQISEGGAGGAPKLLWGYDNASFLYRADISDSKTLLLRQSPVDAFHIPRTGQVVEVLRSALIIDGGQSETAAGRSIVRCVAEATGVTRTLARGYQPSDRSIELDQPLPAAYIPDKNPLFVRVWQSELELSASGSSTVELIDTSNNSTTGIVVTIKMSLAEGLQAPVGAYWLFAARPGTPQAVYPERFLTDGQPPDGPRQWVCPLAVIDWAGDVTSPPDSPPQGLIPIVRDCREKFDNLVELTKRKLGGCCAITLHPEDLQADPMALQNTVDKFANHAQGIALCLTPGTYSLTQPLRLDSRHNGLTVEACHGGVLIQAAPNTEVKFLDGLVVLTQSTGVTVRGISFKSPAVRLKDAVAIQGDNAGDLLAIIQNLVEPHMMIGLRLLDCTDVSIVDCEFQMIPLSEVSNYAAAIFASASCRSLSVRKSRFIGPARVPIRPEPRPEAPPGVNQPSPSARGSRANVAAPATAAGGAKMQAEPAQNASGAQLFFRQLFINNPAFIKAFNLNLPAQAIGPIQVPSPEIPPPSVMLSAFMIVPSISSDVTGAPSLVRAVLDHAEFIDNRMQGLTVAVIGVSGAGKVGFQDNLITDCDGGIWFGGIDNANATRGNDDVKQIGYIRFYFNGYGGKPVTEALSVALAYPLANLKVNSLPALPMRQFHLTGNCIDALPANGAASGPAVILLLAPVRPPDPIGPDDNIDLSLDSDVSLLLNSNELRNGGRAIEETTVVAPTAILYSHAAVVQGNLFQNLVTPEVIRVRNDSLFIAAFELAVTGNVLRGQSFISDLNLSRDDQQSNRSDITNFDNNTVFRQLNSWRFFNYHKSDQPQ